MFLPTNKEQIITFLKNEIAAVIKTTPDSIDEDVNFLKFGISSIQTIMIINRIKKKLELDINPIAMFEYKNISQLAAYLSEFMAMSS